MRINFPGHIGRRGFKRPQKVVINLEKGVINVQELDEAITTYVEQGLARKKGDVFSMDLEKIGVSKVLGTGRVTRKLDVSAHAFSESAVSKIEKAGGKVHVTG